jgi:hypothetical protein
MAIVTTAIQFTAGCLTLGLGLFLLAGAIRDVRRVRVLPLIGARMIFALSGALLLAAGGYAAGMIVPL